MTRAALTQPTPLDVACGLAFGAAAGGSPLPRPTGTPAAALDAAMTAALQRSPCVVSFSGGRDSSLVLAAATRVARREGLPDPIPVTNSVRAARDADESSWQEAVVRHLQLGEWLCLEWDDELDAVGPFASRVLRRHGLLWPFNVHFHVPLLEAARGGALLTGIGGDELFAAACAPRAAGVLRGRVRPESRDVRRVALRYLAPDVAKRWWLCRTHPIHTLPWFTDTGRATVLAAAVQQDAAEPRGLTGRMAWVRDLRYLGVGVAALDLVARDADVQIGHPLLDRGVWSAVCHAAHPIGFLSRTDAMRSMFAHLLPGAVLERASKAGFDEVFFRSPSRSLVRSWTGAGVPHDLVDVDALRAHWDTTAPLAQSFTLLQAAWLASSAEALAQDSDDGVQRVPSLRPAQAPYRA